MSALVLAAKPYLLAIRDIVIARLPSGMLVDDLTIGTPRKMRSGEVRIPITVKPESYEKQGWNWYGATELKHQQIDLADLFEGCVLAYDPDTLPDTFTTEDVLNQITPRYLVQFDLNDYMSGEFTKQSLPVVTIEASPSSFRYKGTVNVVSITSLDPVLRTNEGDPIETNEFDPITIF